MKHYLSNRVACLVAGLFYLHVGFASADVTFEINHCVPAWGQLGSVHFEIDTTYRHPPFFVRFNRPDGRVDSLSNFQGNSHTFEGLVKGRYLIEIRSCDHCSAETFLDVLAYDQIFAGETSILFTKAQTKPELDSTALLLACTDLEKDGDAICSMTFSWYNAGSLPAGILRDMLKKGIVRIRQFHYEDIFENPPPDAWISDPCKILLRFNEQGNVLWTYAEWPFDP